MSLDRLYRLGDGGQVVSATLLDEDAQVVGRYCPSGPLARAGGRAGGASCAVKVRSFHAAYPRSDVTTQSLIDRLGTRAPVSVDRQTAKAVAKLVLTFVLPLVILANLFGLIFLSRGGDSSLADIAGFGRLGKKRQRERAADTAVTFADVAGAEHAVAELAESSTTCVTPPASRPWGRWPPRWPTVPPHPRTQPPVATGLLERAARSPRRHQLRLGRRRPAPGGIP